MTDLDIAVRPRRSVVRILLAAVKLAALYAVGVGTLYLLAVIVVSRLEIDSPGFLIGSPVFAAAGFVSGFLALAVARRVGFALLWILLSYIWAQAIVWRYPVTAQLSLIGWTVFAGPLYVLTVLGLPDDLKRKSWRVETAVTLTTWVTLWVVAAASVSSMRLGETLLRELALADGLFAYVYVVFPFLIGGRELIRVAFAVKPQRAAV
jgi:hypothetical protein